MLETRLTETGRAAPADADERAVRVERGLAAEFTEKERATLVELLGRCARFLDDARAPEA